jgi:hypothetical protein
MIPIPKKGKRLYFDEKELREWIKSGKRMTFDEVETRFVLKNTKVSYLS